MTMWMTRRLPGFFSLLLLLLPLAHVRASAAAADPKTAAVSHTAITVMRFDMQEDVPFTVEVMPVTTHPGLDISGMVLVFDSDLASTTYEITTPPTQGAATIEAGVMWGDFVYSPDADAIGEDSFVVTISDDPGTGPRSIEIVVDVFIRPEVTITDLTCEGALTYTVGEGDWGDETGPMTFRITSPLPEYPLAKAQAEVPYEGAGEFTIAMELRPDTFSDLTATGPGRSDLSIGECDPGGDPELEPWAEIEITELSCDDGIVFTISDGYIPPNIYLTVELEGQYLDGDEVTSSESLGSYGLQSITEGRAIQVDSDLRATDYDQFLLTIRDGGDGYSEAAVFDACDTDPLPFEGTPAALVNRRG